MLGQTISQGPNQKIRQPCRSRPLRHGSQAVMKIQKNIREKKCQKRSSPTPRPREIKRPAQSQRGQRGKIFGPPHPRPPTAE
jgi:hypothetical protein